jgi:Fungal chitosanase of glycosyl hydrolase group 75/Extensin-like protein C-terminus/Bacterial Ig domain
MVAKFTSIDGVKVHYDRRNASDYGTRGAAADFFAETSFISKLNDCFNELWKVCPLGKADLITSAGAFVNRPPAPGDNHALARAFDLDGIFWPSRTFITLNDGFKGGDRKFYFGVEAILKKHFGVVLDYEFNADHRDHFHLDDSRKVDFDPGATSKVVFLQGALVHVMGLSIGSTGIDGDFGPSTQNALATALGQLRITGSINTRAVWLEFLSKIAAKAFGNVPDLTKKTEISSPTNNSTLDKATPVVFKGKADSGVVKVQLLADNTWDLGTATFNSTGDWTLSYTFINGGRRGVIAKGFNSAGVQVAQSQVSFILQTGTTLTPLVKDLLAIETPTNGTKFSLGDTVTFNGKAVSGITKVKLLAEDKFDVGKEVAPDSSGKWTVSYKFNVGGNRRVIAKGFNASGQQVDSDEVDITIEKSIYIPPNDSLNILGRIPSLLSSATLITDSLQGSEVIYKLPGGQIYIDADMDIDADGSPNATTIDPCCGQLETSFKYSDGKSVDSEKVPYFVLPNYWFSSKGIELGDIAAIIYKGKVEYAIFADVGPAIKIGEGSIALARSLGHELLIGGIVKSGIDKDVIYIIFPGSADKKFQDVNSIRTEGKARLISLGGKP